MRIYLDRDLWKIIDDMAARLKITPEEAVDLALRDWAIGQGMIKPDDELDEDTPTAGSA
jgi:hypothetical protein